MLIVLGSTSVLQNFWFKLPLKKASLKNQTNQELTWALRNLIIYAFPRAPKRFSVHLGSRTGSPRPKNQNFQKMKQTFPGIPPSYKFAKFQTDMTINGFPRVP